MCVEWTGPWKKTTRRIVAYKRVQAVYLVDGECVYVSVYRVKDRASQASSGAGTRVVYDKGVRLTAAAPGFYCYGALQMAQRNATARDTIIEVIIPKGTWVRRGKGTINVRALRVGKEVPRPQ